MSVKFFLFRNKYFIDVYSYVLAKKRTFTTDKIFLVTIPKQLSSCLPHPTIAKLYFAAI